MSDIPKHHQDDRYIPLLGEDGYEYLICIAPSVMKDSKHYTLYKKVAEINWEGLE